MMIHILLVLAKYEYLAKIILVEQDATESRREIGPELTS